MPALTGLRFLLALWVILHHLTGKGMMLSAWARSLPKPIEALAHGGYLAVGTFFVLSGFVLARSYGSINWTKGSLLRYGAGRLARVYPAYFCSLLLVCPFAINFVFDAHRSSAEKAAVLTSYGFALQGWDHPAVFWNTPAWSLSCEFFFYLCFPVLAWALRRGGPLRVSLAVAASFAIPLLLPYLGIASYRKPLYHVADFVLGIAASGIHDFLRRSGPVARIGVWLYAPAASIGAGLIAFPGILQRVLTLTGALRPLNAILLIGLALGGGFPARALSTRAAAYLGKVSYSMYILHIPLLWWYSRIWLLGPAGMASRIVSAAIYVTFVLLVSAAVSEWVEEPAGRSLRRWLARSFTSSPGRPGGRHIASPPSNA